MKTEYKPLMFIALLGVGAILFLGVSLLWVNLMEDKPYAPLRFINPQEVLSAEVHVGGFVIIRGTKCNDLDVPVSMTGTRRWRHLDNGGVFVTENVLGGGVLPPGCTTKTFDNPLPSEAVPGLWQYEGDNTVREGDEAQIEAWYSEPVRVLP